MLNHVNIIGRLVSKRSLGKSENDKVMTITIAVPRQFKNKDGEYETDFINCLCYDDVTNNIEKYCNVGDIICIKGRLKSNVIKENDKNKTNLELIAIKAMLISKAEKKDSDN